MRGLRDTERTIVTLQGLAPVVAKGLVLMLQADLGLQVLCGDLSADGQERVVVLPTRRVAIVDEGVEPSSVAWPTGAEGGIVVFAHRPARPYGMLLLEAGVGCFGLDVTEADARAVVQCAAEEGCMFVSSDGNRTERSGGAGPRRLTNREAPRCWSVSALAGGTKDRA